MTAETQISHLNELKAKRDSIEKELKQLQSNLILPMDASLVDGQGFPRNDVDLFQVRAQRQRVIQLRNDLEEIMRGLYEALTAADSPLAKPH